MTISVRDEISCRKMYVFVVSTVVKVDHSMSTENQMKYKTLNLETQTEDGEEEEAKKS